MIQKILVAAWLLMLPFALQSKEIGMRIMIRTGLELSGKLILPDCQSSGILVVLLSPPYNLSDKDNTANLAIADSLARHGYATFLFDNRVYSDSLRHRFTHDNTTFEDIAEDGIDLKEQLQNMELLKGYQIGFIGFSEGGMAVSVAASKADCRFCAMFASPTKDGSWTKYAKSVEGYQTAMMGNSSPVMMNTSYKLIEAAKGDMPYVAAKAYMLQLYEKKAITEQEFGGADGLIKFVSRQNGTRHEQALLHYDLGSYAASINCPMLYVAFRQDEQMNAMRELAWFEKTMLKHGKLDFVTDVVDCTHQMTAKQLHQNKNSKVPAKLSEVIALLLSFLNNIK